MCLTWAEEASRQLGWIRQYTFAETETVDGQFCSLSLPLNYFIGHKLVWYDNVWTRIQLSLVKLFKAKNTLLITCRTNPISHFYPYPLPLVPWNKVTREIGWNQPLQNGTPFQERDTSSLVSDDFRSRCVTFLPGLYSTTLYTTLPLNTNTLWFSFSTFLGLPQLIHCSNNGYIGRS